MSQPRFRWILWLCAAALAAAQGLAAGLLSTDISETVARLETNRATVDSLDTRISSLQQRIANLQQQPAANADAIASAQAAIAQRQDERSAAVAKVDALAAQLLDQRENFVTRTGAARADLATHVSGLRDLEAARAVLQVQIGKIQARLTKLQSSPSARSAEIAETTSRLEAKQAELDDRRAEIAAARARFASFELAVTGGGGSAVLNWSVPTTRADGSPLAPGELAGYEIYVLAESTGDTTVIPVDDPLATTYTVAGLAPDTYHFSMAAIDEAGNPSELSDLVSKTVAP